MSALERISDSRQTARDVRKAPTAEVRIGCPTSQPLSKAAPHPDRLGVSSQGGRFLRNLALARLLGCGREPKHSVSTLRAGATWRTCDEPNLSDNPAVGTLHCTACCPCGMTFAVNPSTLGCQMSKRKPATATKHSRRSPKIAAKAQRAAQAIVRSPKVSRLRSAGAGTTELAPKRPDDSQQEALLVENPVTVSQDDYKQTMTASGSEKGTNFSLATANVPAYQAKLVEIAQANMQFAFEFARRLATIRSPVDFPIVIAEFTSKRIAMFGKFSKEMAELSTKRWTA